jgi:hypothetical protein
MASDKPAMTLLDILREGLVAHGFDGLYNVDGECACKLNDLCPCNSYDGGLSEECSPGYLNPCPTTCGEHSWHIAKWKPGEAPDEGRSDVD